MAIKVRDRVRAATGEGEAEAEAGADEDDGGAGAGEARAGPVVVQAAPAVVTRLQERPRPVMEATPAVRIDKWLWAVRVFRTRTAAATACNGGKVTVNGVTAKASRAVKIGDIIQAYTGTLTRTVKVTALIERRVGAALVARQLEDLTPASEYEAAREQARSTVGQRRPGTGRPTKRDRRILQSFFGNED